MPSRHHRNITPILFTVSQFSISVFAMCCSSLHTVLFNFSVHLYSAALLFTPLCEPPQLLSQWRVTTDVLQEALMSKFAIKLTWTTLTGSTLTTHALISALGSFIFHSVEWLSFPRTAPFFRQCHSVHVVSLLTVNNIGNIYGCVQHMYTYTYMYVQYKRKELLNSLLYNEGDTCTFIHTRSTMYMYMYIDVHVHVSHQQALLGHAP